MQEKIKPGQEVFLNVDKTGRKLQIYSKAKKKTEADPIKQEETETTKQEQPETKENMFDEDMKNAQPSVDEKEDYFSNIDSEGEIESESDSPTPDDNILEEDADSSIIESNKIDEDEDPLFNPSADSLDENTKKQLLKGIQEDILSLTNQQKEDTFPLDDEK
jgi:hypothetical protein